VQGVAWRKTAVGGHVVIHRQRLAVDPHRVAPERVFNLFAGFGQAELSKQRGERLSG